MQKEFYVHGMHCAACEILIKDKLAKADGVKSVQANLGTSKVCISTDNDITATELSKLVEEYGYKISTEKEIKSPDMCKDIVFGLVSALVIFGGFLLIQKLGIVNLLNPTKVTLPFVFFIGIVASLSTCMAVVGGLVLSLSSNYAQEKNYSPLIAFHLSRILGFFILGGVIGYLGSTLVLNTASYFIMYTFLFIVMSVMGLNLLDVFSFTKNAQIRMPNFLSNYVFALKGRRGTIPAAAMGVATFVLPCGFTQSMQLFSLTTGSFIQGALTMLIFALGTFPVLSLISFASIKVNSRVFFTTAGFLTLMFAVFNFITGLIGLGIIQ